MLLCPATANSLFQSCDQRGIGPGNRWGWDSFRSGPVSSVPISAQGRVVGVQSLFFQVTRACVHTHSCTQSWYPGLRGRQIPLKVRGHSEHLCSNPKSSGDQPFSLPRGIPTMKQKPCAWAVSGLGALSRKLQDLRSCMSVCHQQPLHVRALECLCSLAV